MSVFILCAIPDRVGLRKPEPTVATDKDTDSPVLKAAHLGPEGDAVEILPVLTAKVGRRGRSGYSPPRMDGAGVLVIR